MNVEMLAYIVLGIIAALGLGLLGWLAYDRYLEWSEANRRANELLRSVLTRKQYRQLMRWGYLDIPSPRDPECIYRVPQAHGLVVRSGSAWIPIRPSRLEAVLEIRSPSTSRSARSC